MLKGVAFRINTVLWYKLNTIRIHNETATTGLVFPIRDSEYGLFAIGRIGFPFHEKAIAHQRKPSRDGHVVKGGIVHKKSYASLFVTTTTRRYNDEGRSLVTQ